MQPFNHLGLGLCDGDGGAVFAGFHVTIPGYPAKDRRFVDRDLQAGHRICWSRKKDTVIAPDSRRGDPSRVRLESGLTPLTGYAVHLGEVDTHAAPGRLPATAEGLRSLATRLPRDAVGTCSVNRNATGPLRSPATLRTRRQRCRQWRRRRPVTQRAGVRHLGLRLGDPGQIQPAMVRCDGRLPARVADPDQRRILIVNNVADRRPLASTCPRVVANRLVSLAHLVMLQPATTGEDKSVQRDTVPAVDSRGVSA